MQVFLSADFLSFLSFIIIHKIKLLSTQPFISTNLNFIRYYETFLLLNGDKPSCITLSFKNWYIFNEGYMEIY